MAGPRLVVVARTLGRRTCAEHLSLLSRGAHIQPCYTDRVSGTPVMSSCRWLDCMYGEISPYGVTLIRGRQGGLCIYFIQRKYMVTIRGQTADDRLLISSPFQPYVLKLNQMQLLTAGVV